MTSTQSLAAIPGTRRLRIGIAASLIALLSLSVNAFAQGKVTEEGGTLPDGTVFLMRVPSNWNKVLIRDLDYAGSPNTPRYQKLIERGYAVSGTLRHRLRVYQYDPVREIANLDLVLDKFESRFGKPSRVIQFGCSGGGHVTIAVAENFSNRIDGAIAMGAHTPVWLMNTFLDGWFALKVLVGDAPRSGRDRTAGTELLITNLPNDAAYGSSGHGVTGALPDAWRAAIDAAQETPEGRARIALAFTIGQWPAWVNTQTPQPNLDDVPALQHSMFHTISQNTANPGGEARIMFENAASGQQLSWNTGIDYRELFENGNESFKKAVRQLYKDAGADLDADLARLNSATRVAASPYALQFWSAPGRTVRGLPKIPLLRLHEIGDYQVPISIVQGYESQINANGKQDLFRAAYINAPGHCGLNAAETTAAVETMVQRLNSGSWGDTSPEGMNKLAATLGTGAAPRFFTIEKYLQKKYNRVWIPEAR